MRKFRKFIVLTVILMLAVAVYGLVPVTNAASLTNAKDILSDSDLSVAATHTFVFTTQQALGASDYFEITLPAPFGNVLVGNITCPAGMTATASTTETLRCTGVLGAGIATTTLANTTNPGSAGSQLIDITTRLAAGTVLETADVMVAIIDNVDVSATVSSTLTFEIRPLNSATDVNGTATTITSATTSLAFGTLTSGVASIMGQELRVTTNADDGFSVTVEQDGNLTSLSGSDIDSFDDGTSTAPKAWEAPTGTLDIEWEYGHFGYTSEDSTLAAGDTFGANLWQGFSGTTPVQVMYHGGPADGTTANAGLTQVAYQIQTTALQEAGDYTNVLTYIATPTY